MDADAFLRDLEAKPDHLRQLADRLRNGPTTDLDLTDVHRVLLTGMGSSRYAALPIAARLRARGLDATAELASLETPHPGCAGTLVVGISASGSTPETVRSLEIREASSLRMALTNGGGDLMEVADVHLDLGAGTEEGGVACRTFQHTLVLLLALEQRLLPGGIDIAGRCDLAAAATEDLLERRDDWLPQTCEVLAEGPSTYLLAPAERRSSAEQGALMLREGPRLMADACETGDWLHVDVYLTLPLDYRCLLFTGSRFDRGVMAWLDERDGRCVAVGGALPGAAVTVRYRHDDQPLVALLTEVLVAELVAAAWWEEHSG
jgi:glutamine---fructose-6-phosphate transaminase (isomerizing)